MRMALRIWEQYFSCVYGPGKFKTWFSNLVSRKITGASGHQVVIQSKLDAMVEELEFLCQELGGEVTYDDLYDSEEIIQLIHEINERIRSLEQQQSLLVEPDEVVEYLAEYEKDESGTDVDTDLFRMEGNENLLQLEDRITSRVVDQDDAVHAVSDVVRIAKTGLKRKKSPIGSFVFAGPTGVGKTQLAETVADELGMSVKRIDFGQYQKKFNLANLIGAPPGFVGYEDGEGELIEHMKDNPRTVLIFDEIDKADRDVMNVLLQIMEDGRLTSNRGATVRFNEAIIILTSNLGMEPFNPEKLYSMGMSPEKVMTVMEDLKMEPLYDEMIEAVRALSEGDEATYNKFMKKMEDQVNRAASVFFRPEFLNRLDRLMVFNPLSQATVEKIVDIFIKEIGDSAEEQWGVKVKIGEDEEEHKAINKYIGGKGYTPRGGAREMNIMVEQFFDNRLSSFIHRSVKDIRRLRKNGIIVAHYKKDDKNITFELREGKEETKPDIPEEDGRVLTGAAERIKEMGGQPPEKDDLSELFGLMPDTISGSKKELIIDGAEEALIKNSNFLDRDDSAREAVKKIGEYIPEEVLPPTNAAETDGSKVSKSLKKHTKSWVQGAIGIAKMSNIVSYAWENDDRRIRSDDYYTKETGELRDMVGEYFDASGEEKQVSVKWQRGEDDTLKILVSVDSGLSAFLKRELFGDSYKTVKDVGRDAPRMIQGILKAKLELEALGGEIGFYTEEGETYLWLTIPIALKRDLRVWRDVDMDIIKVILGAEASDESRVLRRRVAAGTGLIHTQEVFDFLSNRWDKEKERDVEYEITYALEHLRKQEFAPQKRHDIEEMRNGVYDESDRKKRKRNAFWLSYPKPGDEQECLAIILDRLRTESDMFVRMSLLSSLYFLADQGIVPEETPPVDELTQTISDKSVDTLDYPKDDVMNLLVAANRLGLIATREGMDILLDRVRLSAKSNVLAPDHVLHEVSDIITWLREKGLVPTKLPAFETLKKGVTGSIGKRYMSALLLGFVKTEESANLLAEQLDEEVKTKNHTRDESTRTVIEAIKDSLFYLRRQGIVPTVWDDVSLEQLEKELNAESEVTAKNSREKTYKSETAAYRLGLLGTNDALKILLDSLDIKSGDSLLYAIRECMTFIPASDLFKMQRLSPKMLRKQMRRVMIPKNQNLIG